MRYRSYIQSEEWRELRQAALDHYGHVCSRCGKRFGLHGHHQDYVTPGIKPIQILCEDCHEREHYGQKVVNWSRPSRKGKRQVKEMLATRDPDSPVQLSEFRVVRDGPITYPEVQTLIAIGGNRTRIPAPCTASIVFEDRTWRVIISNDNGQYRKRTTHK